MLTGGFQTIAQSSRMGSFRKISLVLAVASVTAIATPDLARCGHPVYLGRMHLGDDIEDLPLEPSIAQQIDAGRKQLAESAQEDSGMDSNREVFEYFNDIAAKLIAASDQKPLFPISIHVSSTPVQNAFALPGGQIMLYEKMFDTTDNEAELVSVIAHEIAHELHNDFMVFWRDYKNDADIDGAGGVLEQSVKLEAAADATGAQLMYDAGWDPNGMVELFQRFHKFGVMARRGRPDYRSSHPEEAKRAEPIKKLIATLPPKQGLVDDSPRFQELKQKY
jgi:predicted Zn-dependent protease